MITLSSQNLVTVIERTLKAIGALQRLQSMEIKPRLNQLTPALMKRPNRLTVNISCGQENMKGASTQNGC